MTKGLKKGLAALGVALGLGWATQAQAVYVSSDSLTVTIRPTASYSLDVDTGTLAWDLGSVPLGQSTFTMTPTTVTVGSSYVATDLRLVANVISGGWTLDADTTNDENNALKAWAVFTDTGVADGAAVQGLAGAFSGTAFAADGSDVLGNVAQDVGTGGGLTQYVLNAGAANMKSMEDLPSIQGPASTDGEAMSYLWLKFTLPQTTTDNTDKLIQITIGAGAPN